MTLRTHAAPGARAPTLPAAETSFSLRTPRFARVGRLRGLARVQIDDMGAPDDMGVPDDRGAPDDTGAPDATVAPGGMGAPEKEHPQRGNRLRDVAPGGGGAPAGKDGAIRKVGSRDGASAQRGGWQR